jgi:hypothetical protein
MTQSHFATRRDFLARGAAGLAAAGLVGLEDLARAAEADKPLKVAAAVTTFTYRSHAHVILENFVQPYLFNGKVTQPGVQVASMYVDQVGSDDMSRDVARQFNIATYPTIDKALCLGGDRLAVDAVLSICEHGSYPVNAKAQMEYPRKQFFDQIVAVFKRSGRVAPVFNDKHLSYRWDWAKEMVDTSRRMKIPFMAGSSVPLAQRRPPLELPPEAKITAAVSVHGGGVESYDVHCLEVLQSMVEARRGGESGVEKVQFLAGEPLWQAAERGLWSSELGAAAMAAELGADHEFVKLVASRGAAKTSEPADPHGILVHYRDGLRAMALRIGSSSTRWNFACQLEGETSPRATSFYVGPWQNRNLFKALSHAIQTHFQNRKAPYPVERTLLVSGVLDAAMDSRVAGGKPLDTPQLDVKYAAQDFRAMREMGASWKIITEQMPEPMGIVPVGI